MFICIFNVFGMLETILATSLRSRQMLGGVRGAYMMLRLPRLQRAKARPCR